MYFISWILLLLYLAIFYYQVVSVLAFNQLNPKNLPESHITRGDSVSELPCNRWAEIEPGASVRVTSQNYPNNYPSSEYCLRTLVATKEDSKLHFSCKAFDLASEPISPCRTSNDHLKLWENNPRKSKSYCGSVGPNLIKTLGTMLNIGFYTNHKESKQGFDCTVTAINKNMGPEMPPPNKIVRRTGAFFPPTTCNCGRSNASPTVYSSNDNVSQFSVGVHEYPWLAIVKVFKSANDICSASLINEKFLLTSATCVFDTSEQFVKVVLGEHNMLSRSETNQTHVYLVEDITVHPGFNRTTFENDIALIELKNAVDLDIYPGIKPVCLPQDPLRLEAITGQIVGWQSFPWGPEMENEPQQVSVSIMSRLECNSTLPSFNVGKSMICVTNSDVGTCKSDVGGPLVVMEEGRFFLLGIGSVVQDCRSTEAPAIYTDTRDYLDWIVSNTKNANSCLL